MMVMGKMIMTKHAGSNVWENPVQVFSGNGGVCPAGVCPDGVCPLAVSKKRFFC